MPDGDAVRSLDRLRDTVEVADEGLVGSLRELIARNSSVNPGSAPVVEDRPEAAGLVDAWLRRSALLGDVDRLLAGPGGGIAADRQLWTGSATIVRAEPPSAPGVDRFEPVRASPPAPVHARPCGGLWTSTALGGAVSPWSLWREVGAESSSFVGAPTVWRLDPRPGAAVHEIAGAADWTALISTFPAVTSVGVLPDWLAVAEAYDGVHFTMTAAVALQGTSYRLPEGSRTVPMYVDVESTIWLRWVFGAAVDVPATAQVRPSPE